MDIEIRTGIFVFCPDWKIREVYVSKVAIIKQQTKKPLDKGHKENCKSNNNG